MDGDFVVLDDAGLFAYHPTAQELLASCEYPDEAACIMDRDGNYRRLVADGNRTLAFGPVRGPVEFAWLCAQWLESQRLLPGEYRIRRFRPTSMAALLADLFETLDPRLPMAGEVGEGRHPAKDPYGHCYRVLNHAPHSHGRAGRPGAWYVEVNPR